MKMNLLNNLIEKRLRNITSDLLNACYLVLCDIKEDINFNFDEFEKLVKIKLRQMKGVED